MIVSLYKRNNRYNKVVFGSKKFLTPRIIIESLHESYLNLMIYKCAIQILEEKNTTKSRASKRKIESLFLIVFQTICLRSHYDADSEKWHLIFN